MSLYNELIRLCDSIQTLTGVRVCIYDYGSALTAEAQARDQSYFGHYCDFCRAFRGLKGSVQSGRDACIACDVIRLREYASQTEQSFLHKCHVGLTELVIPIRLDGRCIGIAFLGQCAVPERDNEEEILAAAVSYGGDREGFLRLYRQMPSISVEKLLAAGSLAELGFAHLIGSYRVLSIPTEAPSLSRQCENYLRFNFRLPINAASTARALHVNQSYLSRVFRRDMGESILSYLNQRRLEHAKSLLQSTNLPITVIAENVGFDDSSYFTRFFRKATGQTPKEYRRDRSRTKD